ncbi:MAG: toll/interleukin-1 receptor domain-containing protein [Gallionella sp.]|jgi:hypothetical protein
MQTSQPYVFVSYSSVDEAYAKSLVKYLESIDVNAFLDRKDISLGDIFKAKISEGLERCTDLILIASPSSLKSQWVFFELGQAVAFRKRILTFLTHPGLELPSFLADFQFAKSVEEIGDHFKRRRHESARPKGLVLIARANVLSPTDAVLSPTSAMSKYMERFPPSFFHGHVAIDGAVELHTFPDHANPYGGIPHEQLTTKVTNVEWSDLATSQLPREKLDILGEELRTWIGARRAKPNRIRFLTEVPAQMVLDNNEFQMSIGNSDYFTMRTVASLSKRSHNSSTNEPISRVFDKWWSEANTPFLASVVPYHISAQGVLFVTDPETNRRYLVLTLPSRQRAPLVPGWNASFAEQMWAPSAETPRPPWWQKYVTGVTIEPPKDRTGDLDIWGTVRRGMFEELGIQQSDLSTSPKLIASCIEQDMHFVAFIFVLQTTLTLAELHKRRLSAPDREIGPIAAFPIDGLSQNGTRLEPISQLTSLLSMKQFDGGPYLIPKHETTLIEPWHLSSRLRIYAAARHLEGNKLLDYVTLAS